MNEKEMLMKQLRANAFPHNNGKVILPSPTFRGWKLDWVRAALPSAC